MCCFEIGLVLWGLTILITGRVTFTKTRIVEGRAARLIGVVLMLPAPLAFGLGVLIGLIYQLEGKRIPDDLPIGFILVEFVLVLVCLLTALGIFLANAKEQGKETASTGIEDARVNVRLVRYEGFAQTMRQYRDRVVVLDFWALADFSCTENIPFLVRLHKKYGAAGLAVVSVIVVG